MTDRVTLVATLAAQFRCEDGMNGTDHPHSEYIAEAVRLVRQVEQAVTAEWATKSTPLYPRAAEDDEMDGAA